MSADRSSRADGDFEAIGGWPGVLGRVVGGVSLTSAEATCVLGEVLSGRATPAQVGALLVALRAKGETLEEMSGLVRGLLDRAEPFEPLPESLSNVVDVVGTG